MWNQHVKMPAITEVSEAPVDCSVDRFSFYTIEFSFHRSSVFAFLRIVRISVLSLKPCCGRWLDCLTSTDIGARNSQTTLQGHNAAVHLGNLGGLVETIRILREGCRTRYTNVLYVLLNNSELTSATFLQPSLYLLLFSTLCHLGNIGAEARKRENRWKNIILSHMNVTCSDTDRVYSPGRKYLLQFRVMFIAFRGSLFETLLSRHSTGFLRLEFSAELMCVEDEREIGMGSVQ